MSVLTARNVTRQTELGNQIRLATSLKDRAVGLLSTSSLKSGEGMYLEPCRSIHTFFMRYAIDVLFIDAAGRVVSQNTFQPWRLSGWHPKTRGVLELAEGTLARTQTCIGDQIEMRTN